MLELLVEGCRQLFPIDTGHERASADVEANAKETLGKIDRKVAEQNGLGRMLGDLVENGHGEARPGCPIFDGLSGTSYDH